MGKILLFVCDCGRKVEESEVEFNVGLEMEMCKVCDLKAEMHYLSLEIKDKEEHIGSLQKNLEIMKNKYKNWENKLKGMENE